MLRRMEERPAQRMAADSVNRGRPVKAAVSFLVVAAISWFFIGKFRENWEGIRTLDLPADPVLIGLAVVAAHASYLLTTYGWFLTVNALSGRRLTFRESIAMVNASNLAKYVPGRIWSYALQMYWLEGAAISRSIVLYVNTLNVYISLVVFFITGVVFLLCSTRTVPTAFLAGLLAAVLAMEIAFITFSDGIARKVMTAVHKVFKTDLASPALPRGLLYRLHLVYFLAALCFSMSLFLLGRGIGFAADRGSMFLIMSSALIGEVAGFAAVIAPGGVGVREGMMYLMLNPAAGAVQSLILPIAGRLLSMFVEISLGAAGFLLLKRTMTNLRRRSGT